MSDDDNLTVRVLVDIRDEIRGLRTDLGETNHRIDQTNQGLDLLRVELVASETRVATRFVALTASNRDLRDLLVDRFDVRDRVERCEREIEEIKKKVG